MAGKKRRYSTAGNIFWALMIALFIISFAVVFVLQFRPLYYLDIRLLKLPEASGRSAEVIRKNYDAIIRYLTVWNRGGLYMPDFAMSEGGRIHFADCKRIFDVVQIICAVCGIFTLVSFFLHRHGGNSRYLRLAGILTIALPAVIGGLAVWNWDWLFVHFHQLFFRNDYWLFDPTADPIILVLPDAFFLQCAGVIMGIILLGGIICLVRAYRRKNRVAAWHRRSRR